jgi:hypothetical protein
MSDRYDDGAEAVSYLQRHGYRRCDIPACNCGSWHGGHAMARLEEIRDELQEVVSLNGITLLAGVRQLLAINTERDALLASNGELKRELATLRAERDALRAALAAIQRVSSNDGFSEQLLYDIETLAMDALAAPVESKGERG